jgi:hypothetical protein
MQSLALGTNLHSSLIRSTRPSQSMAEYSSLGCHVGSKMVLALYKTLVGGMVDTHTFILVMGAKLLNCSMFRSTWMWVGGLSINLNCFKVWHLWAVRSKCGRISYSRNRPFLISFGYPGCLCVVLRLYRWRLFVIILFVVECAILFRAVWCQVGHHVGFIGGPAWSGWSYVMEQLAFLWLCKA